MRKATTGDTVRVHYLGTLDDGRQFDSSTNRGPVEITIGGGQVIPGFEDALVGMAEGEVKTITLEPDDAYGPRDNGLIHIVERTRIPANIDLNVETMVQASEPGGGTVQLRIVEFDDETVTLDANHPLAGEALTFEVTLVGFVG